MIPSDADAESTASIDTAVVTKAPSPIFRIGVVAVLVVAGLWLASGLVFESGDSEPSDSPALAEASTSTTAVSPAAQDVVVDESPTTTIKPAALAAAEMLRKNPGIGMTLCNAQTKHFNDTPEQVERARRYADCLADFGIPLRLPTAPIHQAYAIPQDLEPSVVLRCGHHLTGPDVSTAAYVQFEACARKAEVLFGITAVTS